MAELPNDDAIVTVLHQWRSINKAVGPEGEPREFTSAMELMLTLLLKERQPALVWTCHAVWTCIEKLPKSNKNKELGDIINHTEQNIRTEWSKRRHAFLIEQMQMDGFTYAWTPAA